MKKKQWKQRRRQQQSEIPADANQIARPASTRSPMEWDSEGQREKIIFWKKKGKVRDSAGFQWNVVVHETPGRGFSVAAS